MVDLREAGKSRREAAAKAAEMAAEMEDAPGAEALRKHFRELEDGKRLPPPSSHIDHKANAMVAVFEYHSRRKEEARVEIGAAEEKARSLGLDLDQDLEHLTIILIHSLAELRGLLSNDPESQMFYFMNKGITDPSEAARLLRQAQDEFELLEKKLEALQAVKTLRYRVGPKP